MSNDLTRKEWIAVVAVALACFFAAGFKTGRDTAPVKTIDRVVTVAAASDAHAQAAASSSAQAASADTGHAQAKTIKRRFRPAPDGGCAVAEETITTSDVATASTKVAARASESRQEAASRATLALVDHLQVREAPKLPGWSLGAAVGAGLDLRPRYVGEVGRRLVGGLWATLTVDVPARAALVGLRWEFGR